MRFNSVCIVGATILLCCSCRLGPTYHPPCTEVPEQWKATNENFDCVPCVNYWWEVFNDDILNQLEQTALANNPNLYVALEMVVEARALAGVSQADLFPQISLNPSYSNSGSLFKFFTPPTTGVTPTPNIGGQVFRVHQLLYSLPLNLSYELDLWGKIRGQYDSAFFNAQAKWEAYRTALLSLTADVANDYFLLRSLDAQIELYQATLDELRKSYELTQSRFDKGLATYIDVAQASLQLTNVEASLVDTKRQRTIQENAIATLLGMAPAMFCLDTDPLQKIDPPTLSAGIPATVLLQRPDIAEAERNMASEHALIGVAYASFLPSIQLTGTIGYQSPTLRDFLKWISRYWAIGTNLDQTIFDGGRNISNLDAAWAVFLEASGSYQQTVLTAFREVEDALNNLDFQAKQIDLLDQSMQSAQTTARLSLTRYKNGVSDYLEVAINQRLALDAERSVIILQGVRYQSTVQLIKAIGGRWDVDSSSFQPLLEEPSCSG